MLIKESSLYILSLISILGALMLTDSTALSAPGVGTPVAACPDLTAACPSVTPFPLCTCDGTVAATTCYDRGFSDSCGHPLACTGYMFGGPCGYPQTPTPPPTPTPTTPTPVPPTPTPSPSCAPTAGSQTQTYQGITFTGFTWDSGNFNNRWATSPPSLLRTRENSDFPGDIEPYALRINMGFFIPSTATITGVAASAQAFKQGGLGAPDGTFDNVVLVYQDNIMPGSLQTVNTTLAVTPGITTVNEGGSTFLWGQTLTPAIVNDPSFGLGQQETRGGGRFFLGQMSMTVYYSTPTLDPASCGTSAYVYTTTAPTDQLCADGTHPGVTGTSPNFTWTCQPGVCGGSTAICNTPTSPYPAAGSFCGSDYCTGDGSTCSINYDGEMYPSGSASDDCTAACGPQGFVEDFDEAGCSGDGYVCNPTAGDPGALQNGNTYYCGSCFPSGAWANGPSSCCSGSATTPMGSPYPWSQMCN